MDRHQGWAQRPDGLRVHIYMRVRPTESGRGVTVIVIVGRPEGSTADAAYGHTRQKHSVEQFSGLAARTGGVTPGRVFGQAAAFPCVAMSERRNPNPHPPRPHLSSLTRHPRASHPSYSCTLIHEEPVFDGFPRRQTCSETRVQFPRKPQRCKIYQRVLRYPYNVLAISRLATGCPTG